MDDIITEYKAKGDVVGLEREVLAYLSGKAGELSRDEVDIAHYELSILYSCKGQNELAQEYITKLGYNYQLCPTIFSCPVPGVDEGKKSGNIKDHAVLLDNCLSPALLESLRAAFHPDGAFFSDHSYFSDGGDRFFSYNVPLCLQDREKKKMNLISEAAAHLLPILQTNFPNRLLKKESGSGGGSKSAVTSVEWWCHARRPGEAHQLHFDLDEAKLEKIRQSNLKPKQKAKAMEDIHPLVSVVIYLEEGSGAPTLVTNQRLQEDSIADKGWLAFPRQNRALAFDGRLLHGVVPRLATTPERDAPCRVTLMLGFWADGVTITPAPSIAKGIKGTSGKRIGKGPVNALDVRTFGPNMKMPVVPPLSSLDQEAEAEAGGSKSTSSKKKSGKRGRDVSSEGSSSSGSSSGQSWVNTLAVNASNPTGDSDSHCHGCTPAGLTPVAPVWVEVSRPAVSAPTAPTPTSSSAAAPAAASAAVEFMSKADLAALISQQQQHQQSNYSESDDDDDDDEEEEEDDGEDDVIVFPGRFFLHELSDVYNDIMEQ